MLFSIIVPVYNAESTIRNCIDSILNQTFSDFEVVVIDDGSSDTTPEILKEYSKKDSRIKVYSFKNAGVSMARQRGVILASGKYFIFVDSDDSISPKLLAKLYCTITYFPDTDLIRYQSYLNHDAPNKNHERYNYRDCLDFPFDGMKALKLWSKPGQKYAVYWIFAFHRDLFANLSFPSNLRYYEDVALIPILVAKSSKIVTINYVGYNYTYNNSLSLTHLKDDETERLRAKEFYDACQYAIKLFRDLPFTTEEDIAFFEKDYQRRLDGKYNSLSDNLKADFSDLYGK